MPRIRSVVPDAQLHIIGRNPTAEVKALDGVDGCRVWGRVSSMPAYLRAADLALVPLEIARGVQNKVLEAMAMGLPVVVAKGCGEAVDAVPERDFLLAEGIEDHVRQIMALLESPGRRASMGQAARRQVVLRYSWSAHLSIIDQYIGTADIVS